MVLLSFIIPVYNVEEYLSECIDSILSQVENSDECELLLIDDGSTDASGHICDEYTSRDNRIKVIHKVNEGVSIARNTGINLATGKYFAFIDSDDRIAPNSIREILSWAKDAQEEICFLQTVKFFPDGHKEDLGDEIYAENIIGKSSKEIFDFLSRRPKYPGSACSKLFLKEFINNHSIAFPTNRKHGEDLTFCLDCFYHAEKFYCLNMPYYEYRQNRQDSATSNINMKMFDDISIFVKSSVDLLCTKKQPKNEKSKKLLSFVAYEYSILLWRLLCLEKENYDSAYNFLKEYKWILKYGKSSKVRMIFFISKFLGIKNTSKIISFIKR